MVCEVQFLVSWMLESKKRGHSIYEIVRKEEFVKNVDKLNGLYADAGEEVKGIVRRKDAKELASFIVYNPNFEYFPKNYSNKTMLFLLAESNDLKGLQLLLSTLKTEEERKAVINRSNRKGATPILHAFRHKSREVFEYIRDRFGFSINEATDEKTPLMWAVYEIADLDLTRRLAEYPGCDLFALSDDYWKLNVFHVACETLKTNVDILEYLFQAMAKKKSPQDVLNCRALGNETPLLKASRHRNLESVKYLLSHKETDILAKDEKGNIFFHVAAQKSSLEFLKGILEEIPRVRDDPSLKKTLVTMKNGDNKTPIDIVEKQHTLFEVSFFPPCFFIRIIRNIKKYIVFIILFVKREELYAWK